MTRQPCRDGRDLPAFAAFWVAATCVATLLTSAPAAAAPNAMSRDDIVKIAKTIPGFSYWWGGAKWKPGDLANKGKCTPTGSSGCPSCTHSGSWGADCSGFVGKAWQVDKPTALETYYHPYSTAAFKANSTWWNHIARGSMKIADAMNYNTNGAGHIFLYEKGDPWGSVWAWECAGCTAGCKYNLRSVSSSYEALQRKLLVDKPSCTAHCDGTVMVDAACQKGDCGAYGSKCVNDSLGLRCVFGLCPNVGGATVCLPDGKLATCDNGKIASKACGAGTSCKAASASKAACVAPTPTCPASCSDGNACTADACDKATGKCSHSDTSAACDDGDACTKGDVCAAGACKAGTSLVCDDGAICTIDSCDASKGACTTTPNPSACDDGNPCTKDSCAGANCTHFAANGPCGAGRVCHAMECVDAATLGGGGGADAGKSTGAKPGSGDDTSTGTDPGLSSDTTAGAETSSGADTGSGAVPSAGADTAPAPGTAADARNASDIGSRNANTNGDANSNFAPAPAASGCSAAPATPASSGAAALAAALVALLLALRAATARRSSRCP